MSDAMVVPNIFYCINLEGRSAFATKGAHVPVVNSADVRRLKADLGKKFRYGDSLGLFGVHIKKLEE